MKKLGKILLLVLTASPAHAFEYQQECLYGRAKLEGDIIVAEGEQAKVLKSMQDSNSIWKAVFHTEKDNLQIQALADAKKYLFLMESKSTGEALVRAAEFRKSKDITTSKLDSIVSLGKREYDELRHQLIAAKIEIGILKGLKEDCERAVSIYDDAYQSAYLGNATANAVRRKELIANLQFHSLERFESGAAKGAIDRLSAPTQQASVEQPGYEQL